MFRVYPKIQGLHKEECDGILNGTCYIQEKVDGANASIWLHEDGTIHYGSRSRDLVEAKDNFNGFGDWINQNREKLENFFKFYPTWRINGEWLCLSGDTVIKKTSGGKNTKGNYMTLREIYNYSNKKEAGRNTSWWSRYGMPSLYSLYPEKDKILPNKMIQVVYSGDKEVYELVTRKGYKIKSTLEHKFLTNSGYVELKKISCGDVVAVTDMSSVRKIGRNLGLGSNKILQAQKQFKSGKKCVICSSDNSLELDHIDENWQNNDIGNWQVLCSSCHRVKSGLAKAKTKAHAKGYDYEFDKVVSISYIGVEDCYDIEMSGPESTANFVAQNFIVHNCRHTISYSELSYKQFYAFDFFDEQFQNYVSMDIFYEVSNIHDLKTAHLFGEIENPTLDQIKEFAGKSVLGSKGEGVVVKNLGFINKFGNPQFGKYVTQEFKEDNAITFGGNNKSSETYNEMYYVNKFLTLPRVQKAVYKIEATDGRPDYKHIPKVMGLVYYDLITEEGWTIAQEMAKSGKMFDFKAFKQFCDKKTKQIFIEIITGDISVAHQEN